MMNDEMLNVQHLNYSIDNVNIIALVIKSCSYSVDEFFFSTTSTTITAGRTTIFNLKKSFLS